MSVSPQQSGAANRARRAVREASYGPLMHRIMPVLNREQWASPSIITDRQWQRARQVVTEAYESFPFYRQRLETAGLDRDIIQRAAYDWSQIPPLDRGDPGSSRVLTSLSRVYAWRVTGGSTGAPLRIPLDREAYYWYTAGMWRGLSWWGVSLGDKGAILLPSGGRGWIRSVAASIKDWALDWLRLPADEHFDARAGSILARLERFSPSFIYGYPSALVRLARRLIQNDSPTVVPRLIVTAGEPLYSFQRELIEHAFMCPVAEEYGCSEIGSIAFQCPEGSLHVTAESVLLEIVQGDCTSSGGKCGKVFATGLRNRLIPLIRYGLGDIAAIPEATACACGRGLPMIRTLGRADELLRTDSKCVPAQEVLEYVLAHVRRPEGLNVRLVQRGRSELSLQVEIADLAYIDVTSVEESGYQLGYHISVEPVRFIPRTALGKVHPFVRA